MHLLALIRRLYSADYIIDIADQLSPGYIWQNVVAVKGEVGIVVGVPHLDLFLPYFYEAFGVIGVRIE